MGPTAVVVGRFDADNKADLLVANLAGGNLTLLKNELK